nr:GNAT family N-acetyltransferase [Celerinatantimonas diazotrophica]
MISSIAVETERLMMVPITIKERALFERLQTDPAVIELCFDRPSDAQLDAKFRSKLVPWQPNQDNWLCLVMTNKESQRAVGITGFSLCEGVAEVGYLLLPEFHGQHYGSESLQGLIDWAVSEHQIYEYQAVVTQGNIASERVLHKCGFRLEQVRMDAYQIGSKLYDDHIYRLSFNQSV